MATTGAWESGRDRRYMATLGPFNSIVRLVHGVPDDVARDARRCLGGSRTRCDIGRRYDRHNSAAGQW